MHDSLQDKDVERTLMANGHAQQAAQGREPDGRAKLASNRTVQ